jgi:taurine dioxygenase
LPASGISKHREDRALNAANETFSHIDVRRYEPALGAEVRGITLADGISEQAFREIRRAFHEHQVLFFKEQQEIPPAVQIAFGRMFGELHFHPAAPQMTGYPEVFEIHVHRDSKIANGEFWHSDVSCDEIPPLGTILQLHILPEMGGDTLFANMYAAYEGLSDAMRDFLGGLTAIHSGEHFRPRTTDASKTFPINEHPVVRTHPETGRKALFVNRIFTTRIPQLSQDESDSVLEMLYRHMEKPQWQCRFKWRTNSIAFWDNRCVLHHAMWDYFPQRRFGYRVTVCGDKPV